MRDQFVNKSLLPSLKTGFIDRTVLSDRSLQPELLVNDRHKGRKVLSALLKELLNCQTFWFSVAFVTRGGVATIINALELLEQKDVRGRILVSQYQYFTEPEALKTLHKFSNIELRMATQGNLHTKGYLFKMASGSNINLIIGSSNLTDYALCVNKEWNLKISALPDSEIIFHTQAEFEKEYQAAVCVDADFIDRYAELYHAQPKTPGQPELSINEPSVSYLVRSARVQPNPMQQQALEKLELLRSQGKNRALLISATGTGKTYLSAFDARRVKPRKFLFVVHRENIARQALDAFQQLLGSPYTYGMYTGHQKDLQADYIFSTIQTLSRLQHLRRFSPDHFDYLVVDETHRVGAGSYREILDYFRPQFLLGMTATPERTDGYDVFKRFDYNIAAEIRLNDALESDMLATFHYFGVSEITIAGKLLDEGASFSHLTSDQRVDHILEKANFYGCDNGVIRGLIFCSRVDEAKQLSLALNRRGLRTQALSGEDSEEVRAKAIDQLESKNLRQKLDYILTVDIFNEGIDIPSVNQIIMLRPTRSAIVFIQQLGRGLRKSAGKSYLTVIDFIGNYKNNFLVPIALFGDNSFNKDTIRKLMAAGSSLIPGASTVNFDPISKKRIYSAIDFSNLRQLKDLKADYELLKFKLGRVPLMKDFLRPGTRDPFSYVAHSKSYYNFLNKVESNHGFSLSGQETRLIEFYSQHVLNAKRIDEIVLLQLLIKDTITDLSTYRSRLKSDYGIDVNTATFASCVNNLNLNFVRQKSNKQLKPIGQIYGYDLFRLVEGVVESTEQFMAFLCNHDFKILLTDLIDCAKFRYRSDWKMEYYRDGFILYRKYSRKDVFRILNWSENPLAQNVGGYLFSPDNLVCPIFLTYHKAEDISDSTKYEDRFISNRVVEYFSKSNRRLDSKDVRTLRDQQQNNINIPLFVKKSNDEGQDFYFLGQLQPETDYFVQEYLPVENKKPSPVVKMRFQIDPPIEDSLYDYLIDPN